MKLNWQKWLQICSNLAILIGIVLVVVEMQQAQLIARAELTSGNLDARLDFALTLVGDSPELALSRACLEPDQLTEEDRLQLRRIMRARILISGRQRYIAELTDFGAQWEGSARQGFSQLFSVQYLRELYINDPSQVPQMFHNAADEALEYYVENTDCGSAIRVMSAL